MALLDSVKKKSIQTNLIKFNHDKTVNIKKAEVIRSIIVDEKEAIVLGIDEDIDFTRGDEWASDTISRIKEEKEIKILDVGGVSTKPGFKEVNYEQELKRLNFFISNYCYLIILFNDLIVRIILFQYSCRVIC